LTSAPCTFEELFARVTSAARRRRGTPDTFRRSGWEPAGSLLVNDKSCRPAIEVDELHLCVASCLEGSYGNASTNLTPNDPLIDLRLQRDRAGARQSGRRVCMHASSMPRIEYSRTIVMMSTPRGQSLDRAAGRDVGASVTAGCIGNSRLRNAAVNNP
jgi:hypothetical protein